jgi:hypothetical protein
VADLIAIDRLHELLSYDPETGEFTNKVRRSANAPAGAKCGCVNRHGYVVGRLDDRLYYMHRLAWAMTYRGWPPKGMDVDHIDRDKANNRISNLRLATRSQNMANRVPKTLPKSGARGVYFDRRKRKWSVRISMDKRNIDLGAFACLGQAIRARKLGEVRHFGQYRRGAQPCA